MSTRVWVVLGGAVCALTLVGFQAAKTFRPPRTAVVDIAQVFEGYEKKTHRQAELSQESEQLKRKFEELDGRLQTLRDVIQNANPGEKRNEKILERTKLEIERKELESKELLSLRTKQLEFLKELREEIDKEIGVYAEAYDLDLVFERTITAESAPDQPGFRWPIVHYAKPEIDITAQIVQRLNERYRRAR